MKQESSAEIYDTQKLRALAQDAQPAACLVLSSDAELIDIVRHATPGVAQVWSASDFMHLAEFLPDLKPGILIADMSQATDVKAMAEELTRQFPEVVIVAVGKRDDSVLLMQMVATGQFFRFLLLPLSHGQTRLALAAALAHHFKAQNEDPPQDASPAEPVGRRYFLQGAIVSVLLIVIGVIWGAVTTQTAHEEVSPIATAVQPVLPPRTDDPVQAELALAQEAFAQARYIEPQGDSALDLYLRVLAIDAGNEAAQAGIRSVANKILERAEQSLVAERLQDAIRDIELARNIDAAHPRLSFLDIQVARERERARLSQRQARDLDNRVRRLLEQAKVDIVNGRLLGPSAGNAWDALAQAQKLAPADAAVAQGLRELQAALASEAGDALQTGDRALAQKYVDAARDLGVPAATLDAVERSLAQSQRPAAAPATPEPVSPAASAPETSFMTKTHNAIELKMQGIADRLRRRSAAYKRGREADARPPDAEELESVQPAQDCC